ncbi:MAG: DUF2800 domain-containing protein [Lysobacter sp.]
MPGAHARFAPSSAHRIHDCPASLLLNEKEPDREIYEAAEGTVAHHVAEICARMRRDPEEFLGMTFDSGALDTDYDEELHSSKGFAVTVDDEMVQGVNDYLDRIMGLPGDHYVETRVNISPWCPIPDQFGTCDHAAASHKKLIITDLKYGRVQVDAPQNKQLVMYALGFINEYDWLYDFDEVIIRIAQPRLDHFDVWVTSKAELLAIGEKIKARFTLALKPNPPFGPSEKACRFCKVNYKCKANHDFLYHDRIMLLDEDDEFVEQDLALMEDAEIAALWLRKGMYEARMRAVEDYLHKKVADGDFVPGLKTVAGRSSRYFASEVDAEMLLLDAGVKPEKLYSKPEFVSPHMAEKLVRGEAKKKLQDFIKSKPGKPCLVSSDDKRKDLTVQSLELLDD